MSSPAAKRGIAPIVALYLVVAIVAIAAGFAFSRPGPAPQSANRLRLTVVDVRQGECSFFITPHGNCIVIGAGPSEEGDGVVDVLKNAGVKKISLLVMPYPYAEAIGGVPALYDSFPIAMAVEQGGDSVNALIGSARALADENQTALYQGNAGDKFTVDGVTVEVLAPGPLLKDAAPPDNSLVVAVRYGATRFLFAGGLGKVGEDALLSRDLDLHADWLRVARSGASDATSPEFLRLVNPRFAVISVGANGDNYPDPSTLDRLTASGAQLFRTDADGGRSWNFYSDGATVTTQ